MKTLRCAAVAIAALVLAALPAFAADVVDPQMDQRLAAEAENAKQILQQKIDVISGDLQTAAQAIAGRGLSSPEARAALAGLCAKHASFVDCATIDPKGIIVALEPASYRKYEGSDVSMHTPIAEVIATKKPVFSDVFKAVEGFWAVNFEWPIFSPNGEAKKKGKGAAAAYEGSVSAIAKPAVFMNALLKPYNAAGIKDVWIMQTDGKVIASRDPGTIGNDFLPTSVSSSESTLPGLLARIVREPKGQGSYRLQATGHADARQIWCGWTTFESQGQELRVIVFQR